jgi:hypothetical protein
MTSTLLSKFRECCEFFFASFFFARRLLNRYSPMRVGNACNLCNGNMSEYPMTHPPTLSRTRLFPPPRRIHIYFTFHVVMNFPFFYYLFVCLFIFFFCDKVKEGPGTWGFGESKVVGKQQKKLTGYCVCVCVCRSDRDCGSTESRCRSFRRNRRVLLPGPRRTDASSNSHGAKTDAR